MLNLELIDKIFIFKNLWNVSNVKFDKNFECFFFFEIAGPNLILIC